MGQVEKTEEQEEELIPVGDAVEEGEVEELDKSKETETEDDEAEVEDDEDEDEEEARLGASEDDEPDDLQAKRRKERKTRKQRQREARDRDAREMSFLRQRNEQLERRQSEVENRVAGSEASRLDSELADVKSKIKLADQVISRAITAQDGDSYSEAQSIRDGLRDKLARTEYAREQVQQQASQPQVDPALINHAQAWMSDHPWWDPNGRDEKSRIVSRLDSQLVNEGWDPTTGNTGQSSVSELTMRLLPLLRPNELMAPDPRRRSLEDRPLAQAVASVP